MRAKGNCEGKDMVEVSRKSMQGRAIRKVKVPSASMMSSEMKLTSRKR